VVHAELRRGTLKKHFVPVGITNRDKRVSFVPVARPGTKGFLLLSRHGVPGWETGTKKVSQPGQIKVSVVVYILLTLNRRLYSLSGSTLPGF